MSHIRVEVTPQTRNFEVAVLTVNVDFFAIIERSFYSVLQLLNSRARSIN